MTVVFSFSSADPLNEHLPGWASGLRGGRQGGEYLRGQPFALPWVSLCLFVPAFCCCFLEPTSRGSTFRWQASSFFEAADPRFAILTADVSNGFGPWSFSCWNICVEVWGGRLNLTWRPLCRCRQSICSRFFCYSPPSFPWDVQDLFHTSRL